MLDSFKMLKVLSPGIHEPGMLFPLLGHHLRRCLQEEIRIAQLLVHLCKLLLHLSQLPLQLLLPDCKNLQVVHRQVHLNAAHQGHHGR